MDALHAVATDEDPARITRALERFAAAVRSTRCLRGLLVYVVAPDRFSEFDQAKGDANRDAFREMVRSGRRPGSARLRRGSSDWLVLGRTTRQLPQAGAVTSTQTG